MFFFIIESMKIYYLFIKLILIDHLILKNLNNLNLSFFINFIYFYSFFSSYILNLSKSFFFRWLFLNILLLINIIIVIGFKMFNLCFLFIDFFLTRLIILILNFLYYTLYFTILYHIVFWLWIRFLRHKYYYF